MSVVSTLPLDWHSICTLVHHRRLPDWRGDLPLKSPEHLPLDVPLGIAVCAQFSRRHTFATEREAEQFRWIGARAQDAVVAWNAAKYCREDCRISIKSIRYWENQPGDVMPNIRQSVEELKARWRKYRRAMRMVSRQAGWVREQLSPRVLVNLNATAVAAE